MHNTRTLCLALAGRAAEPGMKASVKYEPPSMLGVPSTGVCSSNCGTGEVCQIGRLAELRAEE